MATTSLPVVRVGNESGEIQPGQVLDGSTKSFDIVNRQAGAVTLLNITADTLIDASFWWWRISHLPFGRQAYFEIIGAGSVAGLGITASLYTAAGVLIAGSSVTATSTAANATTLSEVGPIAMPSTDTLLQVKFRNSTGTLLGTGSLFIARLNIR